MKNGKTNKKINKQVQDETEKTIKELAPIAQSIIEEISKSNLPVGELHARHNETYDACAKRVLTIMLKANMRYTDRAMLFQLILQKVDKVRDITVTSLGMTFDRLLDKALGTKFDEFRLQEMEDKLLQ